MRGERLAAPILTLLLVVSMVGGAFAPAGVAGPVGTASADKLGGNCGTTDWLFSTLLGDLGALVSLNCNTGNQVAEEWNATDAKETRVEIHSRAGQTAAANEQFLTGMENGLLDSDTVAFSKGEAAAVETLANGGTVEEAQQAANESIEDYYSTKQINLIDRWNVALETIVSLNNKSTVTSGVSNDLVTIAYRDNLTAVYQHDVYNLGEASIDDVETTSHAKSLLNGTSTALYRTTGTFVTEGGAEHSGYIDYTAGTQNENEIGRTGEWNPDKEEIKADRIVVRSKDTLDSKELLVAPDWYQTWTDIDSRSKSAKKEVAVYINDSLAPAVASGELNATSYVSPATLAQEYAQEYGNDTSYIRATAIAAFSGMDAPDLNQTGSMTVTHNGTTMEGLLLSQEAPSGGWQSGEVYDPALLSGLQMFATAGQNSSVVELDGPFSIESIQGTDGQEIQTATTVNVTYETTNESANYSALQQQIRNLQEQLEERKAQTTSGGTNLGGTNPFDALASFLGVSAGAAVVVLVAAALLAVRIYSP